MSRRSTSAFAVCAVCLAVTCLFCVYLGTHHANWIWNIVWNL